MNERLLKTHLFCGVTQTFPHLHSRTILNHFPMPQTLDVDLLSHLFTDNPRDLHEDFGSLNPNSTPPCSIQSSSSVGPKNRPSHIICNPVPNPDVIIQESNPVNFHPIIDTKYQHIEYFDPEEEHQPSPSVRCSNPLFLKLDQHRESNV